MPGGSIGYKLMNSTAPCSPGGSIYTGINYSPDTNGTFLVIRAVAS
jgi:hypothetical protein